MIPEQSLLTGCVAMDMAELSISFSILSDRCNSSRPVGFLCPAAQLSKIGRISVMSRRLLNVSQTTGLPQMFNPISTGLSYPVVALRGVSPFHKI